MTSDSNLITLAREMSETGEYRDWRSIETALRAKGHKRARSALDDTFLRRELDLKCKGLSIYDT